MFLNPDGTTNYYVSYKMPNKNKKNKEIYYDYLFLLLDVPCDIDNHMIEFYIRLYQPFRIEIVFDLKFSEKISYNETLKRREELTNGTYNTSDYTVEGVFIPPCPILNFKKLYDNFKKWESK